MINDLSIFLNLNLSILDILILFGLGQGVFIGLSLLTSKFFISKTNKYFAFIMLTISLTAFCGWLETERPILIMLYDIVWEFLLPPFLFHYFVYALKHRYMNQDWTIYLFIPFFISTSIHILMNLDFQFGVYNLPFDESDSFLKIFENTEYYLAFIFNLAMSVWCLRLIRRDDNISLQYTAQLA